MSTSFASTERITTGFIKQFSTGIANSIFNKRHASKAVDIDKIKEQNELKKMKENRSKQKRIKSQAIVIDPKFEQDI